MRPLIVTVLPIRPPHGDFHQVAEIVDDRCVARQSPIAQHPDQISVHGKWLDFLDNQRSRKTSTDLLRAVVMRVVPIRAGIRHIELVDKFFASRDRLLRQVRHTVHGIRHAHAMPMDGRFLR